MPVSVSPSRTFDGLPSFARSCQPTGKDFEESTMRPVRSIRLWRFRPEKSDCAKTSAAKAAATPTAIASFVPNRLTGHRAPAAMALHLFFAFLMTTGREA